MEEIDSLRDKGHSEISIANKVNPRMDSIVSLFQLNKNGYLKDLYSRKIKHEKFGEFRFPKIYRKTYKAHINSLLKSASKSDIEILIC